MRKKKTKKAFTERVDVSSVGNRDKSDSLAYQIFTENLARVVPLDFRCGGRPKCNFLHFLLL